MFSQNRARADGYVVADRGGSGNDGGGMNDRVAAGVAEQLSVLLDTLDPIPGQYSLVVSSPGLDRPLGGNQNGLGDGTRGSCKFSGDEGGRG